ncbi:MAG: hypothetical protein IKV36_02420 [Clostridia bacterium]|nr:hypothetical protein [Clostridia bacterium]
MKKAISLIAKAMAVCIILSAVMCGCSPKRERPILGYNKDKTNETVVMKEGKLCQEFAGATVSLSGNQTAYFFNYDVKLVNKLAFSTNVNLPTSGKTGILLGKYTDANGSQKTIKSVISTQESKAYLVAFDDKTSEIIAEYKIKSDVSGLVVLTAEYDSGKIAFWVDDEYLYKKTFDLSTYSQNFEFYGGFVSEDAEVEFKFIKIFGTATTLKFDSNTIVENCKDLVPDTTKVQIKGDPKEIELGADKMYNISGANVINFEGLELDPEKPVAYSFTLKTIKVQKSWNGFRPTFLVDENGNKVKMFSLDGSITIFYYNAKTGKDESKVSNSGYTRPMKSEENFLVYYNDGWIYIFLEGRQIVSWELPEGNYTPVFTTLFEFGTHEVTNIKIYQANDVVVY